jgi:Replication-relaxation
VPSGGRERRSARVSADRVFELASHLTGRDREIVLCLYDHQLLTTGQLRLLFFSSKRRAQDRLLFLYRHRLLDRFYPPAPFGAGKPQGHWLLDEAGAILVGAILGVERKQLGWHRRDDWASHPQLRHRLELNRFVTDLIAATLPHPALGVRAWYSSRDAAELLYTERLRPDAGLILDTAAGAIECWLEWDRGTETQARLESKLHGYWNAEHHLRLFEPEPRNILFVVPGKGRIETLRRALANEQEEERERVRRDRWHIPFHALWPMLAATASELRRQGPLAAVWHSITDPNESPRALTELPVRRDLGSANPALALGRRWRDDQPDFWERLSPLHRPRVYSPPAPEGAHAGDGSALQPAAEPLDPAGADPAVDPEAEVFHQQLHRLCQAERDEIQSALARRRAAGLSEDLRPSGVDGLMPDPEDDLDEEEGS